MSYQAYQDEAASHNNWQAKYLKAVPHDTGIVTPRGYYMGSAPTPPYVLEASMLPSSETAPIYTNPVASLYASGNENRVLFKSSDEGCNGCYSYTATEDGKPVTRHTTKPDPRESQVKPLYKASVFQMPHHEALPTFHNVTGMY